MKKTTEDNKKEIGLRLLYSFLGVLLVILIWEIIHFSTSQSVFPEFFLTLGKMFGLFSDKNVFIGLGYSILRIVITLAIVFFLGTLLGLLSAFYPPLEKIMAPLIYIITALPTASLIFIFIIYTKITCELLVGVLTFPIIYKAVLGGGKIILGRYRLTVSLDGRYKAKNFFKVLVPLSLPYMSLSLAQASGLALKAEIMGEVFMSSNRFRGIGVLINSAYLSADTGRLFALTLLAVLFMSVVELALFFIKRGLTDKFGIEPTKTFRLI